MDFFEIWNNQDLKSTKISNYFEVYEELFSKYRDKKITFVEVGLDNGASIMSWKKYFSKNSRIIGIDIRKELKFLEREGIEIFIGDTRDENFWNNFYNKVGNIDILLDDGGHDNKSQIVTLNETIDFINDNGTILVEDTDSSFKKVFGNPSKYSFINYTKKIIEIINFQSPYFKEKQTNINFLKYKSLIYKISYYSSIVALHIDKKKCRDINIINNKGAEKVDITSSFYKINTFKKILIKNLLIYKILRKIKIFLTNKKLKKYF